MPVSQVKIRSSLAQSVDLRDGEPVALVTLVTQDGKDTDFNCGREMIRRNGHTSAPMSAE